MINQRRSFIFFLVMIMIGLAIFGGNWLFSSKANTPLTLKLEEKNLGVNDQVKIILKNSNFGLKAANPTSKTNEKEKEVVFEQKKENFQFIEITVPEGLLFNEKMSKAYNEKHQLNKSTYTFDKETQKLSIRYDKEAKNNQTALIFDAVKKGNYRLFAAMNNEMRSEMLLVDVKEKSQNQGSHSRPNPEISNSDKDHNKQDKASRSPALKVVEGVADVSTDEEFELAMKNKNVTTINVLGDIDFSNYNSGPNLYKDIGIANYRDITIKGNHHIIDFKGRSYLMDYLTAKPINFTIKNLSMYGRSSFGPFRINNNVNSVLNYENIYYVGSKLTDSIKATVNFSGDNTSKSVNSYVSPLSDTTLSSQLNHSNVAAHKISFKENSIYSGTTENATVLRAVQEGTAVGNVTAERNTKINLRAGGSAGEGGMETLHVEGELKIGPYAEMWLKTTEGTTRGGVHFGKINSALQLQYNAKLDIKMPNPYTLGNSPLQLSAGAEVLVSDESSLSIKVSNQGTSASTPVIVAGANSSFTIGQKANFKISSDGSTPKNLIQLGNSSRFSFTNVNQLDLDLRKNTNPASRVISMGPSSVFRASDTRAQAWNFKNIMDIPDYTWSPMRQIEVPYSAGNVDDKNIKATSVVKEVEEDFKKNYRTQKFLRILYSSIPPVNVSVEDLTDNVAAENSHIIRGKTNPGAWLRISGDPAIPEGLLSGQANGDTTLYHTKADKKGNYEYRLPEGKFLTSGNTVTVYSYLDDKSATTSTVVKDEMPPKKPLLNEIKDSDITFTGNSEKGAKINIYKEDGTVFATGQANDNGDYVIDVPSEQKPLVPYATYYAVATDTAGNNSEPSDRKEVKDTKAPKADAITQWITQGQSFTTDAKSLVTNVTDNAGLADLTYTITKEPDVSKIGYSEAQVLIKDKAGNETIVTIPVFIKDSTIEMNDKAMLTANDFLLFVYEYPETIDELNYLLKERAAVKAWEVPSGKDITDQVKIKDAGGISKESGIYNVTFTVNGVDKTIAVTVSPGTLEITKATPSLSFGIKKLSTIQQEATSEENMNITVEDTRADSANWILSAKLKKPFMTEDGYLLPNDSLKIKTKNARGEVAYKSINQDGVTDIYTHYNAKHGITEINLNNPEDKQLILNYGMANLRVNKMYETEIYWTVSDAP